MLPDDTGTLNRKDQAKPTREAGELCMGLRHLSLFVATSSRSQTEGWAEGPPSTTFNMTKKRETREYVVLRNFSVRERRVDSGHVSEGLY